MTFDFVVEDGQDTTTEVPEDVFEEGRISIDEVRAVCLLVAVPARRDERFEEARLLKRVRFRVKSLFANLDGDDGVWRSLW